MIVGSIIDALKNAQPKWLKTQSDLTKKALLKPASRRVYGNNIIIAHPFITLPLRSGSPVPQAFTKDAPAISCVANYVTRHSGDTIHFNATVSTVFISFHFFGGAGLNITAAAITGSSNFTIVSVIPSLPASATVVKVSCTIGAATGLLTVSSNGNPSSFLINLVNP